MSRSRCRPNLLSENECRAHTAQMGHVFADRFRARAHHHTSPGGRRPRHPILIRT